MRTQYGQRWQICQGKVDIHDQREEWVWEVGRQSCCILGLHHLLQGLLKGLEVHNGVVLLMRSKGRK